MKPSERIAAEAAIVSIVVTGLGAWFLLPSAAWWIYLIIWLVLGAGYYEAKLKLKADETIVDARK